MTPSHKKKRVTRGGPCVGLAPLSRMPPTSTQTHTTAVPCRVYPQGEPIAEQFTYLKDLPRRSNTNPRRVCTTIRYVLLQNHIVFERVTCTYVRIHQSEEPAQMHFRVAHCHDNVDIAQPHIYAIIHTLYNAAATSSHPYQRGVPR